MFIRSHGNSKKRKQSFCCTHPSKALNEEAQNDPPKEAAIIVYKENGGIMGTKSLENVTRFQTCIAMSIPISLMYQ